MSNQYYQYYELLRAIIPDLDLCEHCTQDYDKCNHRFTESEVDDVNDKERVKECPEFIFAVRVLGQKVE